MHTVFLLKICPNEGFDGKLTAGIQKNQQIHVLTNRQPVAKGVLSSKNIPWLYTSRYFHIYFILTKKSVFNDALMNEKRCKYQELFDKITDI